MHCGGVPQALTHSPAALPNTGARQISQCYGTVMSKLDLTSTALMDALLLDLGELGAVIGALDRGFEGLAGR
jgi:hypothetical protein